jgi:hypothetical protein
LFNASGRRGRPKGAKNKRTVEREAAMREMAAQVETVLNGAFEGDALAYLTSVYKDPSKPDDLRINAARIAIRYERPPLAPVEQGPYPEYVPLAERLKAYLREDQLEARASNVVEIKAGQLAPVSDDPCCQG